MMFHFLKYTKQSDLNPMLLFYCFIILGECDLECMNGGRCSVISFMKTCICSDDFIGPTCEIGMYHIFLNSNFIYRL